jgi:hypothetical protein
MVDSIKITALQDIGANIAYTTLVPVVNMAGTPTTQKANLQNLGNLILNGAGGSYFARAAQANLALSVANAAQPNITSVGTLTSLAVTGNITAGNANLGNIATANFYYGDGGFLTNVAANGSYSNSNVANYLPTYTGTLGVAILNVSTTANLGAVGNVRITGGSTGQKLTTDGTGNLSWTNDANSSYGNSNVVSLMAAFGSNTITTTGNISVGNIRSAGNLGVTANTLTWNFTNEGVLQWPGGIGQIDTNNSTFEIHSTNGLMISTNEANSSQSFLFGTDGTVSCPANANFEGTRLNVGPGASNVSLTNPTLVITDTGAEFIQAAILNESSNGSSDYAAYGADSDETQGFADLGFAGHTFNDPNYTITEPGDGYVFVQGYANGIGGQLVLATGENGNVPDIIFATGGFLANAEFARIDHANDVFHLTRTGSGIKYPDGSIQTTAAGAGGLPLANGNSNFNIANANGNATVTTAGTQTWIFGTDGNLTIPNDIISNSTIEIDNRASGNTADIIIYSADDITLQARDRPIGATAEGGDINIFAGDSAEDSDTSAGDVVIEAGNGGASNIDFGGSGGFVRVEAGRGGAASTDANGFSARSGGSLTLTAGDAGTNNGNIFRGSTGGDVTINAGDSTGNGEPGGAIILNAGLAGANALAGRVQINIPSSANGNGGTWTFDGTGNLTLPDNTWSVNYANGTQVPLGSGGNTGNVTFDDVTIQGVNQLNLSAGPDYTANLAYLQVRAGDVASHIHFDTGNNEAYDLIVGNDQKFVQVSSTGNIIMSSYDSNTNQYTWTLDTTGNLILADGNSIIRSVANSSLDPINPNVSTMVLTPDPGYSSQSLVLDPTLPGHIHLRAPSANIDEPLANIFLGGEESSFEVGYHNGSIPNVFIHSGGNTWTFDTAGNLTFPRDAAGNTDPILTIAGGATPRILSADVSLAGPANLEITALNTIFTGSSGSAIKIYADDGEIGSTANLQIWTNSGGNTEYSWTFDDTGNLTVPGNTTVSTAESTGGAAGKNISVVAGAADQSDFYTTAGGNLNLSGGLGATDDGGGGGPGGSVNISAGLSADSAGVSGNVVVTVGGSIYTFTELDLNVTTNPPASPAPSLNGFSLVSAPVFTNGNGNVTINSNSNEWVFDSTGNLTIPGSSGGFIKTVANASIGIAAVDNGTNNPAQLLSMTDAGAATSIISAYATNALIQTNATGSINTWAFDSTGNLTLPGNAVAIKFANGSSAFGNIATINLNGNTSQVLLGNGAFAAIPSSSIIANGNSNVSIASSNGNVVINAVGGARITATATGANVNGTLTSTGKIGYASGSTVTQTTNRGNGVTINALAGTIITTSATMVAGQIDTFSVANDQVDPNNDIVLVQIVSPNFGVYNCIAQPSATISTFLNGFYINIQNISGFTTTSDAITIRFMVIKAPNA